MEYSSEPQAEDEIIRKSLHQYYGDSVRGIFVFAGIVMLIGFPFFQKLISLPIPVILLIIIILAVGGGLMNPEEHWVMIVNSLVAMAGFAIFEYYAVFTYLHLPATDPKNILFFWINQFLSLLFFFATYLAVKTARSSFFK